MTEPNFSIDFTALMLQAEACSVGDCLVFDAALKYWRVSSAANRTAAGAFTQAVALTPYGGSLIGQVSYQASGIVAQEVSGLAVIAPGAAQLVRVSTAGRFERISIYTTGDDVIGYANSDGRVALHIGLPWQFIAALGAGAAGLPDGSIQYRVPAGAGALGGAAHASISSDGWLTLGPAPADIGAMRLSNGDSIVCRNGDGSGDIAVAHIDASNNVSFGDSTNANDTYLKGGASVQFIVGGGLTIKWDLHGVQTWSAGVAPTANPTGAASVWIDPSTFHVMQRTPDGTVFDLTATGGGGETSVEVDADPAGADLVIGQTVGTIEIATSGSVTLVGMTAPPDGVSQKVVIANWNDDSAVVDIPHDSGVVAANGFRFPDSSTFHMSGGNAIFYYDHVVHRWCPVRVWVTGT